MKFGFHVSIAGSIAEAPIRAHDSGSECFQIFSRSPQGGPAPKLTDEIIKAYRETSATWDLESYIHTPYYVNFASTTPRIRYGSIKIVREELERGSLLGAAYVMTHLGSAKDAGYELGMHKTWRAIQRILDDYRGTTGLLLEIAAGAGELIGDTFEELSELITQAESDKRLKGKVNVCLDTCHLFASGYDISTKAGVLTAFKDFDRIIGLDRLKLFHGNDSMFGLGEHRDRHEHIGQGKIGTAGFKAIINHPKLKKLNMVLETPQDGKHTNDLKTLKKLRSRT